jgi:hypothetical protein
MNESRRKRRRKLKGIKSNEERVSINSLIATAVAVNPRSFCCPCNFAVGVVVLEKLKAELGQRIDATRAVSLIERFIAN